jgi:hypothetical protein
MLQRLVRRVSKRHSKSDQVSLTKRALTPGDRSSSAKLCRPMLVRQTKRLALAMATLWIGIGADRQAEAGGIALNTPTGLSPGEAFRFVFVTDNTTSQFSSNIGDYNGFVNSQAGGATYEGSLITWFAIGSTSSVNAINNIGQSATPVYLADGTLITSSVTSTGLWSGSLLHSIDEDLLGAPHKYLAVYTGTDASGEASSHPLGDFLGSTIGDSGLTNSNWVNGVTPPSFLDERMYGISQVLYVTAPEPTSLLLAGPAIIVGCACGWSRRRRETR